MADFTVPASLEGTAANLVTMAAAIQGKIVPLQCAMLELDLDGSKVPVGVYLELIPAALNEHGLVIVSLKSTVTELLACDATNPVVTVRDGASSPNTLGTFTGADADAVGEFIVVGSWTEWEALTDNSDYTAQHVEAEAPVEVAVTTLAVDGTTTAGRLLVLVEFYVIPSAD